MAAASLASIMDDQVALSVTCLDRLYLNAYVPTLQAPGQLVRFCREHLGKPIASPALFGPLHDRFVQSVQTFAVEHEVPLIHFKRGQRKDTLAAQYRAHSKVDDGVVFIGSSASLRKRRRPSKPARWWPSAAASPLTSAASQSLSIRCTCTSGRRVGPGFCQGRHLSALPGAPVLERPPLGAPTTATGRHCL